MLKVNRVRVFLPEEMVSSEDRAPARKVGTAACTASPACTLAHKQASFLTDHE